PVQAQLLTQCGHSLRRNATSPQNHDCRISWQQTDEHKSKKRNRQQCANQPGNFFQQQLHRDQSSSSLLRIQTSAQLIWATGMPSPRRPSGNVQSRRLRTRLLDATAEGVEPVQVFGTWSASSIRMFSTA